MNRDSLTLETLETAPADNVSWWDAFQRHLGAGHAWEEAADKAWQDIKPAFYECGICGCYHSVNWNGDCRQDDTRLDPLTLDQRYGPFGWAEVPMPGTEEPKG